MTASPLIFRLCLQTTASLMPNKLNPVTGVRFVRQLIPVTFQPKPHCQRLAGESGRSVECFALRTGTARQRLIPYWPLNRGAWLRNAAINWCEIPDPMESPHRITAEYFNPVKNRRRKPVGEVLRHPKIQVEHSGLIR
jgi:hypothetical protein